MCFQGYVLTMAVKKSTVPAKLWCSVQTLLPAPLSLSVISRADS